jgi:hypothetical protein
MLLDNSIFELGKAFEPAKFAKYVEEVRDTKRPDNETLH